MRILLYDEEADTYRRLLSAAVPDIDLVATADYAEALAEVERADALFALAPSITDELVRRGAGLRWIQALTSGVDTFDRLPSLRTDVLLSSARGIHGPQLAEMAFLLMLSLLRDYPRMLANQAARRWERWPQGLLWRRTICIVGLGAIAEDLARRCAAFEMRVIGVSVTPRSAPGFERVYPREDKTDAFAESDFVVLLTPYSRETHRLIDADALRAMRPDAYLINLARGGVVDESALIEALRGGRIAGAAFDVFTHEPLDVNDPIWTAPNLIATSHMAGYSDCYPEQVLPILVNNISAVSDGGLDRVRNRVWRKPAVAAQN